MATDLSFGSVPAFYREVYEIVCPFQEHVDHDMFLRLLVKSSLPTQTLSQIWEAADNKQGYLSRNGLYKALALTALAQQGKSINEKILEAYSGQELPKPNLGDLSDMKALCIKIKRERTPNVLAFNYQELCALDTIKVELVPEKRGLILKHVEYEVTSQKFKVTVLRRYNDFLAFQELLLVRYPYRMIPRLPPKKMMGADREFIEQRRRSLKRFLMLIGRHPVLSDDQIVKYFLTFSGSDMQYKIKEHFKGVPDEFMTCEVAKKAKEMVPIDTQQQFANSKDHIRKLLATVTKLRDIADRNVTRAMGYAHDMLLLGKELSVIGNDNTGLTTWACGNTETWLHLKRGFKQLAVEYAPIADKAASQASREADSIVEELNLFLELLYSYRDLCERQEKGVNSEHHRALQKLGQYKKKKMSATISSQEIGHTEQLEQRILDQESEISNMENRNYYSLLCIQLETQLIHANLDSMFKALDSMVVEEGRAHSELAQLWEQMKPRMMTILPHNSPVRNGTTSPSISPLGSPNSEHRPGLNG